MIARLFHAWEHRLAAVTTDRVVRPFEWGADWLPQNGHGASAADELVTRWVDEVMRDTPAFFTAPPTADYELSDDLLRFPSALVTPHPQNNTVVARWFPAAPERRRGARSRHRRADY